MIVLGYISECTYVIILLLFFDDLQSTSYVTNFLNDGTIFIHVRLSNERPFVYPSTHYPCILLYYFFPSVVHFKSIIICKNPVSLDKAGDSTSFVLS